MPKSILLLPAIIFIASCHTSKKDYKPAQRNFSYFELNYHDPLRRFQFCTDSNRIFFIPQGLPVMEGNTVKYGLLPDSIYNSLNGAVPAIKKIHSLNPDSTYCYDCPEIAVVLVSQKDTVKIYQAGNIDSTFYSLINKLDKINKDSSYNNFKAIYFQLETYSMVIKPLKLIN